MSGCAAPSTSQEESTSRDLPPPSSSQHVVWDLATASSRFVLDGIVDVDVDVDV